MESPLLGYLNLTPVGALNDAEGAPDPDSDKVCELSPDTRAELSKRREASGRFESMDQLLGVPGFGPDDLASTLERLGDLRRYGHRARPVWGGPESEREFFELLESAQHYIHIQTYIIGGEAGLKMARVLARKMKEGVKVRVLFCASGFVLSGSPSGTGFVSRFSQTRSYLFNDMYYRKRLIREMTEAGVPFINSSPIGRHWKRGDFKKRGIRSSKEYFEWARALGVPDEWIDEQQLIDQECSVAFSNVDHRKMVIIDGDRAFVGAQNIADSYFYSNELSEDPRVNVRNWQWHDSSTVLEGGCVRELNSLFANRWIMSGGDYYDWKDKFYSPPMERAGDGVVSLVTTIPGHVRLPLAKNLGRFLVTFFGGDRRPHAVGSNPIGARLLGMPELANNDFYVEHCYPSNADVISHWTRHASRVKDFHMIVPHLYDTKVLGAECDRFYPELMEAGVKLHGYHRAIMHSKISVMDGFYVATGSYNLTFRSSRADMENEFFIQDTDYGRAVKERMLGDMEECQPIEPGMMDRFRSRWSVPVFDAMIRFFLL